MRREASTLGETALVLPGLPILKVGLVGIVLAFVVTACTADSDPSIARIVNDLQSPVRVRLCASNDCKGEFYPRDGNLAPGGSLRVNVSSVGVPNVYLVETQDGDDIGCLPFVSPSWRPALDVGVSEAVPCRAGLDEDTFWPRRWQSTGE